MSEFPAEGYQFLNELNLNNNRDWFSAHKKEYEAFVKKPSEAFADELTELVGRAFGGEFGVKIYRIHRDVRFSKDKTPYNPYVRMTLSRIGTAAEKKGCDQPGLHFSIETGEVIVGCGMFGFEGEALTRFRKLIVSDVGAELAKILDEMKAQGGRMDEPELKRVPTGFDGEHPREELLRRKGLAVWFHEPGMHNRGEAITPDQVVELFKKTKQLFDWMQKLV